MAASAVLTGFVAGLFGIGGGLITVPVLFYIFSSAGLDQTFIMHLAVGTSFAIIIPTSIASTMTHIKFKGVDFGIVKTFGIFAIIGVILGTIFAASLKETEIKEGVNFLLTEYEMDKKKEIPKKFFQISINIRGAKTLFRKILPLTLITAVIFILGVFLLTNYYNINDAILKVIFIGLASLTFPHILLEYLLEKNEKRT